MNLNRLLDNKTLIHYITDYNNRVEETNSRYGHLATLPGFSPTRAKIEVLEKKGIITIIRKADWTFYNNIFVKISKKDFDDMDFKNEDDAFDFLCHQTDLAEFFRYNNLPVENRQARRAAAKGKTVQEPTYGPKAKRKGVYNGK